MTPAIRFAGTVLLGLLLVMLQAAVSSQAQLHPFVPHLAFPVVIFLGVTSSVPLLRGAITSFLIGYLFDIAGGNAFGLQTFVCVAVFIFSRTAGLRLFSRNVGLQMTVVFGIAAIAGGLELALRAIFAKRAAFPVGFRWGTVLAVVGAAGATALISPIVVPFARLIESIGSIRREEAT